jgi:hypothetical protein
VSSPGAPAASVGGCGAVPDDVEALWCVDQVRYPAAARRSSDSAWTSSRAAGEVKQDSRVFIGALWKAHEENLTGNANSEVNL